MTGVFNAKCRIMYGNLSILFGKADETMAWCECFMMSVNQQRVAGTEATHYFELGPIKSPFKHLNIVQAFTIPM